MEADTIHPLEIEAEEINETLRQRKRILNPRRNSVRGSHGKRTEGQPTRISHHIVMTEREIGQHSFNS